MYCRQSSIPSDVTNNVQYNSVSISSQSPQIWGKHNLLSPVRRPPIGQDDREAGCSLVEHCRQAEQLRQVPFLMAGMAWQAQISRKYTGRTLFPQPSSIGNPPPPTSCRIETLKPRKLSYLTLDSEKKHSGLKMENIVLNNTIPPPNLSVWSYCITNGNQTVSKPMSFALINGNPLSLLKITLLYQNLGAPPKFM